jgi:hypothetical protein
MVVVPSQARVLRDDVHAVAVDDDAVFLDVARDTYVCVPNVADRLVLDAGRRVMAVADGAFARELERAGLLSGHGASRSPRWPVQPATESAMTGPFGTPRWPDPLDAARAMADVSCAYWRQPLAKLVAWADEGATALGGEPPTEALLEVVAGFHRWAPYLPAPGKCLLRSFMLLRVLRRHGHDARWVFGVRTWPFRAHCWLQRGGTVLDDDVEPLVALTPILVV